jgi:hypothetical protein
MSQDEALFLAETEGEKEREKGPSLPCCLTSLHAHGTSPRYAASQQRFLQRLFIVVQRGGNLLIAWLRRLR